MPGVIIEGKGERDPVSVVTTTTASSFMTQHSQSSTSDFVSHWLLFLIGRLRIIPCSDSLVLPFLVMFTRRLNTMSNEVLESEDIAHALDGQSWVLMKLQRPLPSRCAMSFLNLFLGSFDTESGLQLHSLLLLDRIIIHVSRQLVKPSWKCRCRHRPREPETFSPAQTGCATKDWPWEC